MRDYTEIGKEDRRRIKLSKGVDENEDKVH